MISQTPFSFAAAVIVATGVIWLVFAWIYSERFKSKRTALEDKESTINLLNTALKAEERGAEGLLRVIQDKAPNVYPDAAALYYGRERKSKDEEKK